MTTALTVTQPATNAGDMQLGAQDTSDARLVDMWLHSGKRANSAATQSQYMRAWRQFSGSVNLPLQSVTLGDLQAWRETLTGAPSTQRAHIAAVRSLFSFAVKVGYLRMSPAVMIEPPAVGQTVHERTVTQENVLRLFDACQTATETALLRVLYGSGARVSEVLALRWVDVQPRGTIVDKGAILHIVMGKGHKSREAGVNGKAYAALLALRDGAPDSAFCFATRSGKALDRQRAHRLITAVAKRAGLKDAGGSALERLPSCHWLRHGHASHALQNGANVVDVQQQLGHASLATTTIYAHASKFSCDALTL